MTLILICEITTSTTASVRASQPGTEVIEDADELLHRFGIVHRRETGQQIEAEEGADDLFDRP